MRTPSAALVCCPLPPREGLFAALLARASGEAPIPVAIAHPCDDVSITAIAKAAHLGLVTPILVGPGPRILAVAASAGVDISHLKLVDVEHSHAAAAAAVRLVTSGEAAMLMKGSLHTDELLQAVLAAPGLRTGRRLSHVYLMDVPRYPRPLLITDAVVNIAPSLDEKRDIVQNAIELAHILGIPLPRVAILAAVELVNSAMRSTLDAAVLSKMAERGQITGGIVDGPLAFDNAISPAAAKQKGIVSVVAGLADILLTPDLEAGNMLAKELSFLGGADAAGIVLGARVPIVLTSRADSMESHVASCALAALVVQSRTGGKPLQVGAA